MSLRLTGNVWRGKWNAGIDGTYIDSFRSRIFESQPYVELAGQWSSRDLFPRWKHQAYVGYDTGPWNMTLYQTYTRGTKDQVPSGVVPAGFNPEVDDYITYTLSASYSGFKNMTISVGVIPRSCASPRVAGISSPTSSRTIPNGRTRLISIPPSPSRGPPDIHFGMSDIPPTSR